MVKTVSVADYIVERLATEGINHCFGVAGDYVFPICDWVDSSAKVKWIGCANELNASYAADGYARIRGAAMLVTTYGVGELSALNGVMGAKAERSLVFHVVGMPSYQHQRCSCWWPAGNVLLDRARRVTAEWDGLDVYADECLPFGALAEAHLQPAKRRPLVLIRRRQIELKSTG
jgi:hypothetical protein